ncbi:BQ2448_4903 [Microbotryum intermedium]|uniref:BQ2448_4903 protein n=1 Tax=Microbotryum intermedium TaxID=269621 RepID=A0A238FHE1_9BASI|nr:BQ2448_4903 [Microbotryum intermedium]
MASIIKRFSQAYSHSDVPTLVGSHYFITGGTNGIGLSISRTLYSRGAHLHLFSSSDSVADQAMDYIKTGDLKKAPEEYAAGFGGQQDLSGEGPSDKLKTGKIEWDQVDFKDLNMVATKTKELALNLPRLDGCFLLAGIGVNEFQPTAGGCDAHLTINNLSNHVILSHLLPIMIKTSRMPDTDVRILTMSSENHRLTFGGPSSTFGGSCFTDEEEFKKNIGPSNLYSRTKLGNILFTKAIVQRHLQDTSTLAFATHPGAVATGQQNQFKDAYRQVLGTALKVATRPLMSRPDQGAISTLWAGMSPSLREEGKYENGSYFNEAENEGGETSEAQDQELIDNFFDLSEEVIKKVVGKEGLGTWTA